MAPTVGVELSRWLLKSVSVSFMYMQENNCCLKISQGCSKRRRRRTTETSTQQQYVFRCVALSPEFTFYSTTIVVPFALLIHLYFGKETLLHAYQQTSKSTCQLYTCSCHTAWTSVRKRFSMHTNRLQNQHASYVHAVATRPAHR